jgi:hypothetical protein
MSRICYLSIHPAPYRDPVISCLYLDEVHDVDVIHYYQIDDGHKEWEFKENNYKSKYLQKAIKITPNDSLHVDIVLEIMKNKYDLVIIPGYTRIDSLLSVLLCFVLRIPYIITSDKISEKNEKNKSLLLLINIIVDSLISRAKALWVAGSKSKKYYIEKGVNPEKVFEGAYCLKDQVIIDREVEILGKNGRDWLKNKYSIAQSDVVFLAVGKFRYFRRYSVLVKAIKMIMEFDDINYNPKLLLIGSGEEELLMKEIAGDAVDNIIFCGDVRFGELHNYYYGSDVFVHPGAEPFSTAMEYAARTGMKIISTSEVGYLYDAINTGLSPEIIKIDDVHDLCYKIKSNIDDICIIRNNRGVYAKYANKRSVDWCKNQLLSAINVALRK